MRILVLGGRGFIGRHVVRALISRGHTVIIGTRHNLGSEAGFRQVRMHHMTAPADWHTLLNGIDAVVNTVGILRERIGESYAAVHHRAPAALAKACATHSTRLVHISALGLHRNARSRFLRSKLAGEQAITLSGADYMIVRPSLVDGEGGFGAKWIRRAARLPIHCTCPETLGRIAAVDACDLGEAIAILCEKRGAHCTREIELGGAAQRNMRDYLAAMRPAHLHPALSISVPFWLARVISHLCDVLHFSPFSFGHLELMRRDNLPRANHVQELLGRPPRSVGLSVICPKEPEKPGDLSLEMGG